MFGIENYEAFLVAGILLNMTPGQDTIYIVSRSVAQGKKAGVASTLGIATGSMVHTIAATLGLSAILFSSPMAFTIVKYLGAGYLLFLGIQMIFLRSKQATDYESEQLQSNVEIYRKGILTNILNPKVAMFFIAFLPQFISVDNQHGSMPFLILGLTFIATGTVWSLLLVYFSSYFSAGLRKKSGLKKIMEKICGIVFISLGFKLFFTKR